MRSICGGASAEQSIKVLKESHVLQSLALITALPLNGLAPALKSLSLAL